jgi:hypothetical protein
MNIERLARLEGAAEAVVTIEFIKGITRDLEAVA